MRRQGRLQDQLGILRDEAQTLQNALLEVDQQFRAAEEKSTQLRQRMQEVIRQAILAGEKFNFSEVDEQVAHLGRQLQSRQQQLLAQIDAAAAEGDQKQQTWQQALTASAAEEDALEHCDALIDQRVAEREDVKALVLQEREIGILGARLEQRRAEAEKEAQQKRIAYETDRYFRYLWQRGFGNPRYVGKGLYARLDRWLAEACNYSENARHYQLLLDLPAHLQQAQEDAAQKQIDLKMAIMRVREEVAVSFDRPRLQASVDLARQRADAAKLQLEQHATGVSQARDELRRIESNGHRLHGDIQNEIATAITDSNLARFVKATLSDKDDQWLREYEQQQRALASLESERHSLQSQLRNNQIEADDLARAIARETRQQQYAGQPRHGRRRGGLDDDLGKIAAAVLAGVVLGRSGSSHAGGWGGGSSGGGWSGGSSGDSSGGGFDSGGGFGGGDFDSGDSF